MSALVHIKSMILSEMRQTHPELKKAIFNVINALDTDLDNNGYTPDTIVEQAIINLDSKIIEIYEPLDNASIYHRAKKGEIPDVLKE